MTLTIILLILAIASLALNVLQFLERRLERKYEKQLIADAAAQELKLNELRKDYENEVNHRKWAIGRIKDQSATIRQLERNLKPKKLFKPRKENGDE